MVCVTELRVARADLQGAGLATRDVSLAPGEVLLAVERFAVTANNITYAAFGEEMGYWRFFPAAEGWGIVPVWGFATVAESACDGVAAGTRIYGYLPMATHLVVRPESVRATGFADAAPHRAGLPAIYNFYQFWSGGPDERAVMVFRPLFATSFLLDDHLASESLFGAETIALSSASSKTALGLAWSLKRRGIRVIGLTSPANDAFVTGTGCYDRVIDYADAPDAATGPTVYADFAGDGALRAAIHQGWGERLVRDIVVGGTHWQDRGAPQSLPGPKPAFFFAPDHYARRRADWGAAGFEARLGEAFDGFVAAAGGWTRWIESAGVEAMGPVYRAVLDGKVAADEAHLIRLA